MCVCENSKIKFFCLNFWSHGKPREQKIAINFFTEMLLYKRFVARNIDKFLWYLIECIVKLTKPRKMNSKATLNRDTIVIGYYYFFSYWHVIKINSLGWNLKTSLLVTWNREHHFLGKPFFSSSICIYLLRLRISDIKIWNNTF